MQRLDYYEFVGYVAPGGALLFGVGRIYPAVNTGLAAPSLTVGDLAFSSFSATPQTMLFKP